MWLYVSQLTPSLMAKRTLDNQVRLARLRSDS